MWRPSKALLQLAFGFLASSAAATTIDYSITPGSTLQFDAGPVETLTGGFTIECPVASCTTFGVVDFDVVSIELQSPSFTAFASGPATLVTNGNGAGFIFGRTLTLLDAGTLQAFSTNPAQWFYGFDPMLESATDDFDRYRIWVLSGPGTYAGLFVPDSLAMQWTLQENIIDLGPTGIVVSTVGQQAQLDLVATQGVPEPSTGLSVGAGLLVLGIKRRARSRARARARAD